MPDKRRLVVTENVSANGVIEFVDDWFDPAQQDDADDLLAVMHHQMASEEALLLGRKTFEQFRGYWPQQTDDASGIAAHLNRVPEYRGRNLMPGGMTPQGLTLTECRSFRSGVILQVYAKR